MITEQISLLDSPLVKTSDSLYEVHYKNKVIGEIDLIQRGEFIAATYFFDIPNRYQGGDDRFGKDRLESYLDFRANSFVRLYNFYEKRKRLTE